ncbi:uncharacterized protein METZ01_LOCUS482588, partial [marine metagenome]
MEIKNIDYNNKRDADFIRKSVGSNRIVIIKNSKPVSPK